MGEERKDVFSDRSMRPKEDFSMELRFSGARAAIVSLSLFLAVGGTAFAMTPEEEDAIGQQMVQAAAERNGLDLSRATSLPSDVKANVVNEIIKKNHVTSDMESEGRKMHDPYFFQKKTPIASGMYGGYSIMSSGALHMDNVVRFEQFENYSSLRLADRGNNRIQDIYCNSRVAGTYTVLNASSIFDLWREEDSRLENVDSSAEDFRDVLGENRQSMADIAGQIVGNNVRAYYATKGDTLGVELLDATPYLSSGGILAIMRRGYFSAYGKNSNGKNTEGAKSRFFKIEEVIKKNSGGRTEIKSLLTPYLFLNGKRNLPYSVQSDNRLDVDNFERCLYVHGQIAQAMHDGMWVRSKAVLKRESELFPSIKNPNDEMVYLCLPMAEEKLEPGWEEWMVVDKYRIPAQYMNDKENAPEAVYNEIQKLESLMKSMA